MVLVSGPTGSGKTTTLYASVNQLNDAERKIITIEDPVEYQFDGINQIQVNEKADITFATGLRSLMRLDPDVILVGEVRDGETARIACQAALTGHLVLSSIHANDAVGVLLRLTDLGIEPFLAASSLIGVVAQRMVRRVCAYCAADAQPSAEEQAMYEADIGEQLRDDEARRRLQPLRRHGLPRAHRRLRDPDAERRHPPAAAGERVRRARSASRRSPTAWCRCGATAC